MGRVISEICVIETKLERELSPREIAPIPLIGGGGGEGQQRR